MKALSLYFRNVPTLFTIARIILIIPLAIAFFADSRLGYISALVIFLVAAGTDVIDGYLARRFDVVSNFGGFLDAMADRLLVVIALVCLLSAGAISYYSAIPMIFREIIVDSLRSYAASKGVVLRHNKFGKMKMLLIVATVLLSLILLSRDKPIEEHGRLVMDTLIGVSFLLGLISARQLSVQAAQRLSVNMNSHSSELEGTANLALPRAARDIPDELISSASR